MDSGHRGHVSPTTDSEDEGQLDAHNLQCPSPLDNPDEIDVIDRDAPSPPLSSLALTEKSWSASVSVSPRSPNCALETVSKGTPCFLGDNPSGSPEKTSPLPALPVQPGPLSAFMLPPGSSSLFHPPPHS